MGTPAAVNVVNVPRWDGCAVQNGRGGRRSPFVQADHYIPLSASMCPEPDSSLVASHPALYRPAAERGRPAVLNDILAHGRGSESMATAIKNVSDRFGDVVAPPARSDDGYRPTSDEPFMNERQQAYFRRKLLDWKEAILRESQGTLSQLQVDSLREADLTDRASSETDWSLELRTRDRQRKLISKIEAALRRIDEGEYGYCEVTGEPISLGRLEARPIATMTVEAQERHERAEKVSRDD